MTKKLEEEFNLPSIEEAKKKESTYDNPSYDDPFEPSTDIIEVQDVEKALSNAEKIDQALQNVCLLYTSPSPRDRTRSRMPSSA